MNTMKNLLITGYNGFIGSHLISNLDNKYRLIGISSKDDTKDNILKIKKDIRKISLSDIPRKIDCIIHLVALTDVKFCQENPTKCMDVNLIGTQKMLEIARKLDSKFVYVSTNHVYGRPRQLPIKENHPKNPISEYAISKQGGEVFCETYSRAYGLDISIPRLFSVYGPRSPQHLVTSRIINQILTKKIIKLGNLYPQRDFVYIKDVIEAIKLITKKTKGFNSYNIGTGKSHSILKICKILKKISNKNFEIKSVKSYSRNKEIPKIVSDSTKLRKLGWKPEIEIEEGLKLTYNLYKRHKD